MSGTSLDGLDIAYCRFERAGNAWSYSIPYAETVRFPDHLLAQLKNAKSQSAIDLAKMDIVYGEWMGKVCQEFKTSHQIQPQFIASHGYTVFHQPENNLTLQIGNGYELFNATQTPVVFNFRQLDVALGGQGAPLVPFGDRELFGKYGYSLNLGGFANISFERNGQRIAGDICPVNIVLNAVAQKLGKSFDENGALARLGQYDRDVFDALNGISYYQKSFPKSLGSEWVDENILSAEWLEKVDLKDLLHTFVHHAAYQIAQLINEQDAGSNRTILCTGGGTHNRFLVQMIEHYLDENTKLIVPEKDVIDYKEALIFAFLGLLKLRNENNTLASATGAKKDSSGGVIVELKDTSFGP